MEPQRYRNPVYAHYFADPFVWRDGECWYAIGTGRGDAAGAVDEIAGGPSVFEILSSANLVEWRAVGHALVRPDAALGDTFWAPEIAHADDRWFLYYSVGHEDRDHQLRVAASAHAAGPYVDVAGLTDLASCRFAIDPHPFRDDDGRWYLFHARDFLDDRDESGSPVRPGTALVVHALDGMTKLARQGRTVARARFDWQRFATDREMYGRVLDWHTLEGPFVVKHDGRYFCFYSGGCWRDASYGVDYVVADGVQGPYSDAGGGAAPRVLATVTERVLGPGHCSIAATPGGSHVIVYHAWDPNAVARRMCIDALEWSKKGPRSPGPTWTPQPAPDSRAPS
jgi:beta-xylosidase